jgi:hypothetical protein
VNESQEDFSQQPPDAELEQWLEGPDPAFGETDEDELDEETPIEGEPEASQEPGENDEDYEQEA